MFCCLFVAGVKGFIRAHFDLQMYYITTNITPITEEIVKALPICIYIPFRVVFVYKRRKRLAAEAAGRS